MVTVGRVVAAVAALALAAAISPAHAQTLRGQIVEEGTSRPIEAAMISLIDEAGKRVGSAWSDASGRFFLRAPGPGAYTLHVERIGYETAASPVLELAAGQTLDYRMEVPMRAITLDELTAIGDDRRCVVRPDETSAQTARVWEEARKALDATLRSETERILRFEGATYRRRLDPDRGRVLEETIRPLSGYYRQPFESRPAEELAREGYVRAVEGGRFFDFFAPSAEVLLSDSFVEHHCMRLVAGRGETEGMIGLAFEPVRGRDIPDIKGTFWLDPYSARLRFLEFTYVAPETRFPTIGAGGRVDFATLPNGLWFVRRWSIRMPLVESVLVPGGGGDARRRVTAIQEDGGEVVRVYPPSGEPINMAIRAQLDGVVYDSTRPAPLSGATVRITGTTYWTRADAAGRFRISDVPPGVYGVEFWHTRLDSLPLAALPPVEVVVTTDNVEPIELAVPPLDRILATACPAPDPDAEPVPGLIEQETGVLVVLVRDPRTGLPVPRVPVSFAWNRHGVSLSSGRIRTVNRASIEGEAVTDEAGRFWVCNVPLELPIRTEATLPDGRTLAATVRATAPLHLFTLDSPSPAGAVAARSPDEAAPLPAGGQATGGAVSTPQAYRIAGQAMDEARMRGSRLADVIRSFTGLSVREGSFVTRDGSEFGICVESDRRPASRINSISSAAYPFCEPVVLVVNGARVHGPVQYLAGIRLDDVESVEFLGPIDAAHRFGQDAAIAGGALLIWTRSGSR